MDQGAVISKKKLGASFFKPWGSKIAKTLKKIDRFSHWRQLIYDFIGKIGYADRKSNQILLVGNRTY